MPEHPTPDAEWTVVGLGPVPEDSVRESLGPGLRFVGDPGPDDLAVADAAIVRAAITLGAEELESMPRLRAIARTGVGVDDVDVAAAARRRVAVAITPGTNSRAVAEGTFAHILHLVKGLGPLHTLVRDGGWEQRSEVEVGDLEGARLGLIGYGRIGRMVADFAQAFSMEVLAHDPVASVPAGIAASFDEVVAGSDVLSLHVPLTPATRNLISVAEITAMRPGTILVNCSRGGLVDLDAALSGLRTGHLGGLGLDSFDPEPAVHHPVFDHPRVVLTPHVMGLSRKASEATFTAAADAVRQILTGGDSYTLTDGSFDPRKAID